MPHPIIEYKNTNHFRYLFDAINTLQGLWVFLIFVCKREVFKLILKSAGVDSMFGVSSTGRSKTKIQVQELTFFRILSMG